MQWDYCSIRVKVSYISKLLIGFYLYSKILDFFKSIFINNYSYCIIYCSGVDDDIAKNVVCTPHDAPNFPSDWFKYLYISQVNTDKLYGSLGNKWMEENRLSIMSHMSQEQLEKMKSFKNHYQEIFYKNLKEFGDQKDIYGKSQSSCKKAVVGG